MDTSIANWNCNETQEDGGEVIFNVSNPCYGRSLETCEPFYFVITLTTEYEIHNCTGQLILLVFINSQHN